MDWMGEIGYTVKVILHIIKRKEGEIMNKEVHYTIHPNRTATHLLHNNKVMGVLSTVGIDVHFSEYKKYLERVREAFIKSLVAIDMGGITKYRPEKIQDFEIRMPTGQSKMKLLLKGADFAQFELSAIYSSADEVERFAYRVAKAYIKYLQTARLS